MREIPKSFKLNEKEYTVREISTGFGKGSAEPKERLVCLVKNDSRGVPFSDFERYETFWHELTHCIVWEMNYNKPLAGWRDEPWISKFSKLLNEAITTARF